MTPRTIKPSNSFARTLPLVAILASAACGVDDSLPSTGDAQVLGWIEGSIDPERGIVSYRTSERREDLDSATFREQDLTVLTEDRNGAAGSAAAANTVEFVVECNGTPTCAAPGIRPGAVVNGCGGGVNSYELDVTARSFFPAGLAASYLEFTSIRNVGVDGVANTGDAFEGADSRPCNGDPIPRNLRLGGAALSGTFGQYRYGQLLANPSAPASAPALSADTARWKLRNPGGIIKFVARMVAEPCTGDCTPGVAQPAFWQAEGSTNAVVSALAEGDGVIYVGGSFNYVGPRTGAAALLGGPASSVPGQLAQVWPAIEGGDVFASVTDGAGGFYIGGAFTTVGGVTRNGLARITSAGVLDTGFNAPVVGAVRSLALSPAGLIVGGSFTSVSGVTRANLARVNATSGAVDAGFLAEANGVVNAVAVDANRVFVGGAFTSINGVSASRVARLSAVTGALDLSFATAGIDSGAVNALSIGAQRGANPDNRTLIVGGSFTDAHGATGGVVARQRLALFDVDAASLVATSFTVNGAVFALTTSGSSIYVGGDFTVLNGNSRQRAALVTEAGAVASWRPVFNDSVLGLAIVPTTQDVIVAGAFNGRLALANGVSGAALPWPALVGPNNSAVRTASAVRAVAISGNNVAVGGSFRSVGGERRLGLGALDLATGRATAFDPFGATARDVLALTLVDGVLVTGATAELLGVATSGTIAWQRPVVGTVRALAALGGTVHLGGDFTSVNGTARVSLAAVNAADGALTPWRADANAGGVVRALTIYRDEVYAGGTFTSLGGAAAVNLATLNASTGVLRKSWSTNATGRVNALTAQRNAVYVGGLFSSVDGVARNSFAAIDGTNVTSFSASANQEIDALHAIGNNIVVGGVLTTLQGQPCGRMCAVSARGVASGIFSSAVAGRVQAVSSAGTFAFGGGSFLNSSLNGGIVRTGLAGFTGE